jgi:hypothetical protein
MLHNPFTPTEMASLPEDFFGRSEELDLLKRSLSKGSVLIQGPMGIGKSSLLAQLRLRIEGFGSDSRAHSIMTVAHREIKTADELARQILERFVEIDETQRKLKLTLPKIVEYARTTLAL